MKTRLLSLILLPALAVIAFSGAAAATDNGGTFPFPPVVRDLPNGLRAVLIKTPYPEIVSLHVTVSAGSRDEVEEGKSGFAHFFEHMMFRGTENYSADVYGEILKKAGADQNAYTTDDYTNYHLTFSKDDLEKVLELEADRFQFLKYSDDQFKTEARAVLGEYNKNYANPIRKMLEYQRDLVFREHTYKHTTMGFIEDIEDMPNEFEYSRQFYQKDFYRPERTVVNVVGDIDVEQTYRWVEKYFGKWKSGAHTPAIKTEPAQESPIAGHVEWPSPTLPWVAVGFRGPAFSDEKPDMACMDLIQSLLFSGSSDLFQKLVVEERKVDQMFPHFPDRKDPYLVTVFARVVNPEYAESVRDEILATFAKARNEVLDDGKIQRTKKNLKYGFVHGLDSSEAIADVLARYVHFRRDPSTIDKVYELYDSVAAADLQRTAKQYFLDSQAHVVTLSHEPLPGSWDRFPTVESAGEAVEMPMAKVRTVAQQSGSPLVNFRLAFLAGPADDPPGKEGLATLTAAMITGGGTRSLTYKELTDRMFPLAAGFGGQVDKEMTVFGGVIHRDNLDEYYGLVKDQLLAPGWRDSDFERVKTNLVNSIKIDLVGNNDEELGKEVLYKEIYRGHPYGHLNQGYVAALEQLSIEDCKSFYEDYYTQANLVLGISGGFDDAFLTKMKQDLAALPRGTGSDTAIDESTGKALKALGYVGTSGLAHRDLPAPRPTDGWKMTIVEKDTRATGLHWGFPIEVTRSHPDFTALWLVRSWLGEHRSSNSHLYQRIREVRGMNYGDYAYIEYFPRGGGLTQPDPNLAREQQIFQVWIRPVVPTNAQFALRVSLFEFEKLLDKGLSEEQFEATREFLSKYVNLLVKTQDRQLGYEIDSAFYGTKSFAEKTRKELAALTVDQVNAVIKKHLQMDNVQFVAVAKDGEELKKILVANGKSSIKYDGEKSRELLDEDEIIHQYKLHFSADDIRVVPADKVFSGE